MARLDRSPSYNSVAKFLHWLIALGIVVMLALGWIMTSLDSSPDKFRLFQLHKSIGITILLLSLFRLGWRMTHKVPPLPATMPRWERVAALATHWLFYVLIIGIPFTGWVIVSSSPLNLPTILYGVIPWPHLPILPTLENRKAIGHITGGVHGFLAYVIAGLLVLHIGAAWKHHLINKDDVLTRMAPKFLHRFLYFVRGQKNAALFIFAALGLVLSVSGAAAKTWHVDYDHSRLGFVGTQGTATFGGSFRYFQTAIDLDPAHPETGKITATIDIGSISAGSTERDSYLPQSDWFNTKQFPEAQFTSTSIKKLGDGSFVATGTLTIKGITKTVDLPFTLTEEGDHWHALGKLSLARTDFHVGEGDWANEAYVKHAVDVTVDIVAKPQP